MLCDSMVAQDVHCWERKCLNNERFVRLQDLSFKIQNRMRRMRNEINHKLHKFMVDQDDKNYKMQQDVMRKLNDGLKNGHREQEELRQHFIDLKKECKKYSSRIDEVTRSLNQKWRDINALVNQYKV